MLGEKIDAGERLTRQDQLAIRRDLARQGGKRSGARIVLLMLAAVTGVLGFSQGVLAISGDTGAAITEDLVAGGQD